MKPRSTTTALIFIGASFATYAGGSPLSAMILLSIFTLLYAVEADLSKADRGARRRVG